MRMKSVLITGSSGLIGSEAVEYFDRQGHHVVGVDNNMRRLFFGEPSDTTSNLNRLKKVTSRFDRVEQITGKKVCWEYQEEARKGDHICYISDLRKLRAHFPKWQVSFNLDQILEGIVQAEEKQLGIAQRT